jgi:hypothetical protein
MPAAEIALLKLKPNTNINEGDAQSVWQETVNAILSQPGAQRLYYGVTEEDPAMLRLSVDWGSIGGHQKFMASDSYRPLTEKIKTILDSIAGI